DAVGVGDDPPVVLLRLALVRDLDLDADGVALQHRAHDLHGASEERHAGAVDEPGLHDQPLAQRESEGAGRGSAAEDGLALDVLHVHEQRLGEAAQVHEVDDVGLGDRAGQRAVHVADLVLLEGRSLTSHVGSPLTIRIYSPRYARRTSAFSLNSAAVPDSTTLPVSST